VADLPLPHRRLPPPDPLYSITDLLDIDLEKTLFKKIAYNKTRPYRHGKKF
jgi:hypothetical protein